MGSKCCAAFFYREIGVKLSNEKKVLLQSHLERRIAQQDFPLFEAYYHYISVALRG
jgi:chemotaxis methyl-accepting protein methylase